MIRRNLLLLTVIAVAATACSSTPEATPRDAPKPITHDVLIAEITTSGKPTVVNVWASWCLPCRSEAPLLATAAVTTEAVHFIGLGVRDNPAKAAAFIAEYYDDVPMTQYSDRSGAVPIEMGGGRGVPITFFYDAHGNLVEIHRGIIDEPTLALFLDEIQR